MQESFDTNKESSIYNSFDTTISGATRTTRKSTTSFASFASLSDEQQFNDTHSMRRTATAMSEAFDIGESDAPAPRGPGSAKRNSSLFSRGIAAIRPRSSTRSTNGIPKGSFNQAVIIFDWDDTLLPTTYIKHVVGPKTMEGNLLKESPFLDKFRTHAKVVEEILRAASKVAHVAIVTLATEWWVEHSSDHYLPGLDLPSLLSELDMAVYSADRQSPMVKAYALSGRDPSKVAKKVAMGKLLRKIYNGSDAAWNVLSVGDSEIERDAIKECCSTECKGSKKQAICKTIKVSDCLPVADLTKELQTLMPNLRQLAAEDADFDRTIANMSSSWGRLRKL
jgi:hypothetical protein